MQLQPASFWMFLVIWKDDKLSGFWCPGFQSAPLFCQEKTATLNRKAHKEYTMNRAIFPCLPDETLAAVNTVGEWLAQDDVNAGTAAQNIDFVVLAGNAVIPTIDAACRFAATQNVPLLISGGIGHSTSYLYAAIAHHPRYHGIATTGRAEASILADVARQFWHVPPEHVRVDDQSTNCGENARFSWNMMKQQRPLAEHVLVVQDPTMQRRTMATFARVCRDEPVSPQWVSHPGLSRSCKTATRGWCSVAVAKACGLSNAICRWCW
jgi:uncharacterized SAM-binding protein YcdF (DUF218 family)